MIKYNLIAFLLFTLPAFSQQQENNALLWKISGHGLSQPSYLFGTMHVLCQEDLNLSPAVMHALDSTQALYLELKMDDPAMVGEMQQHLLGGEGYSLKKLFTPGDFALTAAYFKDSLHTSLDAYEKFKLFTPTAVLTMHLLPCKTQGSLEMALMNYVKPKGHPVLGLETVAEEMSTIDEVPDSVQLSGILEVVRDPAKARANFARLRTAYLAQRLDSMMAIAQENKADAAALQLLTIKRNQHWMPVIEKAMHAQPVFIACGAYHLLTPHGLLALLRNDGYTLTPVF
ncbi:hypothetical protein GA0116948_109139 [Chitinophaga costaii]|uniref:TraB family protein n=1 Tax=Chitinophaga costaii TaxID=1335309 RepID=A0A1C4ERD1_9BACT|nr:TraB/GumN family protein [Chitinophaga costaii]PUZ22539.1 TraB/GumN family protein [Chitinophaga costaii]SCC46139.1 hypothetical protein GA0116948_109139 [Chitinophaga costaii]